MQTDKKFKLNPLAIHLNKAVTLATRHQLGPSRLQLRV